MNSFDKNHSENSNQISPFLSTTLSPAVQSAPKDKGKLGRDFRKVLNIKRKDFSEAQKYKESTIGGTQNLSIQNQQNSDFLTKPVLTKQDVNTNIYGYMKQKSITEKGYLHENQTTEISNETSEAFQVQKELYLNDYQLGPKMGNLGRTDESTESLDHRFSVMDMDKTTTKKSKPKILVNNDLLSIQNLNVAVDTRTNQNGGTRSERGDALGVQPKNTK